MRLLALLALLGVLPLPAQRQVLTVGGPGASHQTLPAAVAAAQPGALLLVRSGTHTGFATSKPLTILLDFQPLQNPSLNAPTGAPFTVDVSGLPAGTEFVLKGRAANVNTGTTGALRFRDCAGDIVIEGINATGNGPALEVSNCGRVLVQNCLHSGSPCVQVADSNLAAVLGQFQSPLAGAVVALRSRVDLFRVPCSSWQAPAVAATDGTTRLVGDGITLLQVRGAPLQPVPAVQASGGTLDFDPAGFLLLSLGTGQHLQANGTAVTADGLPILVAAGAPTGGTAQAVLSRAQATAGFLVLGFPGPVQGMPGVGDVWLDLAGPMVLLAVGLVDPAGLPVQITVPAQAVLAGMNLGLQGVALAGSALLPSNPAAWVLL